MKHLRENEGACEDCKKAHNDHVMWYNLSLEARQKAIDEASK